LGFFAKKTSPPQPEHQWGAQHGDGSNSDSNITDSTDSTDSTGGTDSTAEIETC
jgi:hypothetical protein